MSRKKLKSGKNDDEASTPMTSVSNTGVVNDRRKTLRSASTQKDNHLPDDSVPLRSSPEDLVQGVLHHAADEQHTLSSPLEGLSIGTGNQASPDIALNQPAMPPLQPGLCPLNQPAMPPLQPGLHPLNQQAMPPLQPGLRPLNQPAMPPLQPGLRPLNQPAMPPLQPGLRPLNQRGSCSVPDSYPAPLDGLQHHLVSVYQSGSSSNPGLNWVPSFQLPSHCDSLNQPGSSSNSILDPLKVQKLLRYFDSLNLPTGSSSPLDLKLQPFDFYVPELGTTLSYNPGIAPPSNVLSQSTEAQQSSLPEHRNIKEHFTQLRNLQISDPELQANLSTRCERVESKLQALKRLLHPNFTVQATETTSTKVLPPITLQGGENRSQLQRIHSELNSSPIQSQLSPKPSIPMLETRKRKSEYYATESGPGSTSGNFTADDESNKPPFSIAAAEVLFATDTDRTASNQTQENDEYQKVCGSLSNLPKGVISPPNPPSLPPFYLYDQQLGTVSPDSESNELQGNKENTDTSCEGNTQGDSTIPVSGDNIANL